jgi:hypothetical protein
MEFRKLWLIGAVDHDIAMEESQSPEKTGEKGPNGMSVFGCLKVQNAGKGGIHTISKGSTKMIN